ncbi:MAG: 3-oxoacyl-ACP reductase family protein [Thermodesulfobacteriota bacterium]
MRFKGKVALITGAGSGIGRITAHRFAREGAGVIINDVVEEQGRRVEQEIKKAGGLAVYAPGDVSNRKEVEAFVRRGLDEFGRLDILVNNAAVIKESPFIEIEEASFDRLLRINLKGVFVCCQVVVPIMLEQRYGKIVNIGSRAFLGSVGQLDYVTSKGGVVSLTRGLALEFARQGLNVNCVAPGPIMTGLSLQVDKKRLEAYQEKMPMGRFGEPEDIAAAVLFLASDEASFITGQTLLVDGGLSLGAGLIV